VQNDELPAAVSGFHVFGFEPDREVFPDLRVCDRIDVEIANLKPSKGRKSVFTLDPSLVPPRLRAG
jgi:hypothetical protein